MKIVIADDDCLVAEALKTILEVNEDIEVQGLGADGREAYELYRKYKPDGAFNGYPNEKYGWPGSF